MISCLSSGPFLFEDHAKTSWICEDFRNNHQWISCEFLYSQGVMKSTGFLQGCWVLRLPPIVMMFVITIAGKGDNPTKMEPFSSRFGGCPFFGGPKTRWLLQESALTRENCDGCAVLILFCHSSSSSSSSSSFPFNMLVTYSWYHHDTYV